MRFTMTITKRISIYTRRVLRRINRVKRKKADWAIIACLIIGIIVAEQTMPPSINPTAYTPLLNVIARGESAGNYNAYFGNASNQTIRFTSMTVAQVMEWQKQYVDEGHASNAVGRYQFMGTTLTGLVERQHISPTALFDEQLQDRLAIALIERRGSIAFVEGKVSQEQFAANLAQEWAALPRVLGGNPNESYYAGDGLNHAKITTAEVLQAVAVVKTKH